MTNDTEKSSVRKFWEEASAGEFWAIGNDERERLTTEAAQRYVFEPYLPPFADFASGGDRDVLEIGTGMGTDHLHWAKSGPRSLAGMDLSGRGVAYTRARLLQEGFIPRLMRGDAEKLPFADSSFDLVYSWGVIHHSPDTPAAVRDRRFPKTRKMDWVVINGNAAGIDGNPERYVEDGCAVEIGGID